MALLVRWLDEVDVAQMAPELGLKLNYWHVMDTGRDSVELLARWLDGPGKRLPPIVVLNEVRGDGFEQLEASGLMARAQAMGGRSVRLRKLPDSLLQKIDGAGQSFWAAMQPAGVLGLLDRQRVRLWLQRTSSELATLDI